MGPAAFGPRQGLDVRPHPHIGLATITYLFEGEILHRDSLGTVQAIRPGEVNWMTAGKGIVHSERTPQALRDAGSRAFGIQAWVALPREREEDPPAFIHAGADRLPFLQERGCRIRLIIGTLFGARSPVPIASEMFYADATLEAGGTLSLRAEHEERAAYITEGTVELDGTQYGAGQMLVFKPGSEVKLGTPSAARMLLLGGASVGPRFVWWNFVSSRKERIAQAAEDWKAGRFPAVPGETEFIPLPERAPGVVDYP
jgi:redox-sensitive bicupin YhaK (pirin superfamily)